MEGGAAVHLQYLSSPCWFCCDAEPPELVERVAWLGVLLGLDRDWGVLVILLADRLSRMPKVGIRRDGGEVRSFGELKEDSAASRPSSRPCLESGSAWCWPGLWKFWSCLESLLHFLGGK